jgi:hypothetical protein
MQNAPLGELPLNNEAFVVVMVAVVVVPAAGILTVVI